jgi:hypothetical protein
MSYVSDLRAALSSLKDAKETSRSAGSGMWANYVRSTCYPETPASVEALENAHKSLIEQLNQMRELTKEEKNSLRSAKSVIGKAISNGVDVWQTDERSNIIQDDNGDPLPKGKSELQEAMTDFQRLMKLLDQFDKTFSKDTRDPLTAEELESLKDKFLALSAAVGSEYSML